jgi:hypothetical protein
VNPVTEIVEPGVSKPQNGILTFCCKTIWEARWEGNKISQEQNKISPRVACKIQKSREATNNSTIFRLFFWQTISNIKYLSDSLRCSKDFLFSSTSSLLVYLSLDFLEETRPYLISTYIIRNLIN